MKGKRVLIIDGDFKGKTGVITYVYQGWTFEQYTILSDEDNKTTYVAYHTEVKEI